jgi:electron transfer flavoprotein beta subunit
MNILVLLKRVPDTAAKVQMAADGLTIDPSGVEFVMNPYDEIAVEQAIQLKESGGGQITVLCLGPKEATKEIRTALAMGADEGIDGAVPHLLAAALGMPCVTMAVKLETGDGSAIVHREVEGATEVVETSLPAVITVQKGLVEPRYTSLKGIMMAKRKKIDERPGEAAEPRLTTLEMALPPPRQEGRIVGEGTEAVPALIDALSDEQKLF